MLKRVLHIDANHTQLWAGLAHLGYENVAAYHLSKLEVQSILPDFDGLVVRSRFPIDAEFLKHATQLRWIARVGAGMENIDLQAAQIRNIRCLNAPEGNARAVAEHALGLLLSLSKNIVKAHTEVLHGSWLRESNRGWELQGKTLGIVGCGVMGTAFGTLAAQVGMRVMAYDKYKTNFGNNHIAEVSLATLQKEVDVLSLHLPITQETQYFVNAQFLNGFTKPIVLLNTARGGNVNLADLCAALHSGQVLAAGLDVLEYEKSSFEGFAEAALPEPLQQLMAHPRVVLTPHIAGWSHESAEKMANILVTKVAGLDAAAIKK
jgi:D-3-phosphoglycerate dehydrogenase / 2-oxoglutarate reductase